MPIDHTCSCGKKLRLKDEFAGKRFRCPACSAVNQAAIPAAPASQDDWLSAELLSQSAPAFAKPVPAAQIPPTSSKIAPSRRSLKSWFSNFDSKATLAMGVIALLAIPYVAFTAYNLYCRATASIDWPSTDGTITHSSVEMKRRKARTYPSPKIEYRYVVNGQEYTGVRISFVIKEFDLSDTAAQDVVDRYPLNSTRKVYYDPADPSSCTLETGASTAGSLMTAAIPIGLLAVGVHLVRSSLKEISRGKRRPHDGLGRIDAPLPCPVTTLSPLFFY